MQIERIIEVDHDGRRFTFRVDEEPPFAFVFWRVESEGRIYKSAIRVTGTEESEFFRALADVARHAWCRA